MEAVVGEGGAGATGGAGFPVGDEWLGGEGGVETVLLQCRGGEAHQPVGGAGKAGGMVDRKFHRMNGGDVGGYPCG